MKTSYDVLYILTMGVLLVDLLIKIRYKRKFKAILKKAGYPICLCVGCEPEPITALVLTIQEDHLVDQAYWFLLVKFIDGYPRFLQIPNGVFDGCDDDGEELQTGQWYLFQRNNCCNIIHVTLIKNIAG